MPFDHEKLDVYQLAIEFVAQRERHHRELAPRTWLLGRSASAGGPEHRPEHRRAGKFSPADKAVFYTRARASATESAAVLDVSRKLNLIIPAVADDKKALLERIAQMLTKLIKSRRPTE